MAGSDPVSQVVYACRDEDVTDVVVDGRPVVADGHLNTDSLPDVVATAEHQRRLLLGRAGSTVPAGYGAGR